MSRQARIVWAASCMLVGALGCGDSPAAPSTMGAAAPNGASLPNNGTQTATLNPQVAGAPVSGMMATGGLPAGPTGTLPGTTPVSPTTPASPTTPVGTSGAAVAPISDLPCDVSDVLSRRCWKCHGTTTDWGGPMSLTAVQDFQQMGKLTMDQTVSALVKARISDTGRPMPPTTEEPITTEEVAVLTQWVDAGMPAGAVACDVTAPSAPTTGTEAPGSAGAAGTEWSIGPGWPGGVAPEETCYQFLKHGGQSPDDTSPHMTDIGETYANFFYKVPWTEPSIATSWRTIYDNTQVLHHWLLFNSGAPASQDGEWTSQPAGGLLGLTAGLHNSVELVAGWAVGGNDENFPEGVGLKMPASGRMFELEWHLYNTTGAPAPDRSGIEICVVPESAADPKYVADLTWLGTEDLDIKPNSETKRGGLCTPAFRNGGPITILKWLPHMHNIGTHMDSWVLRADGTEEHVFSEPFQFDRQISYVQDPPVILNEGDRVHSVCTFRNESPATILFGQSSNQEMCYQFVFAFPAGSLTGLNDAVLSGAHNGCLSGHLMMDHAN